MGRRLCVGLQELRRRRAVRYRGARLRLARADDERADDAGRQDRARRSRARHRHPPLPAASAGPRDLDQRHGLDLRLDRRAQASRQARRQCRACPLRRDAGEGRGRHHRGRLHDQGPGAAGRAPIRPGSPPPAFSTRSTSGCRKPWPTAPRPDAGRRYCASVSFFAADDFARAVRATRRTFSFSRSRSFATCLICRTISG